MKSNFISLRQYCSLILHSSLLEIKMRYKESYLGLIWTALEPLLMFVILYIVFTSIRERTEDFAIYLITGIIIYHLFSKGTGGGLVGLRSNQGILKSLSMNKIFFPLVAVTSTAILMMVELGVFFSIMPFVDFLLRFRKWRYRMPNNSAWHIHQIITCSNHSSTQISLLKI